MARDHASTPEDTAGGPIPVAASPAPAGLVCGLVMPLALTDGRPAQHWAEVRAIIQEAVQSIEGYEFKCDMVSNANESAVIQTSIVRNLNTNDVVICDVSGRNPNVMFELGMRVAFDMPVVLIKDDQTDFSFDIGPIAHLVYPRDLRYGPMQGFKADLAAKVKATYEKHAKGDAESSYLASFGPIKVAQLQTQEVPLGDLLIQQLNEMQNQLTTMAARMRSPFVPESMARWKELSKISWQADHDGHSGQVMLTSAELSGLQEELSDLLRDRDKSSPVSRKKALEFVAKRCAHLPRDLHMQIADLLLDRTMRTNE
ncbi:hypothetical protein D3C71_1110830 [compost metagenome]